MTTKITFMVGNRYQRKDGVWVKCVRINGPDARYPIIMQIEREEGEGSYDTYSEDGQFSVGCPSNFDLVDVEPYQPPTVLPTMAVEVVVVRIKGVEFTKAELETALAKFA